MQNRPTVWALILVFLLTSVSLADDWPQFRGPQRDGKSAETGLLKKWPAGGPKLLWTVKENLGVGFSHVAVAQGLIYITGMDRSNDGILFAFDLDGQLQWKINYGPEWSRAKPGARTIPTIEDDRLYLISGMGVVWCLDAKTGAQKWTFDANQQFQGQMVSWGWAESPLLVDNKVICTPGGQRATMAALDKMTGKVIWSTKELTEKPCYCSPILVRHGGKKIIVTQTDVSLIGVDAADGKLLWQDKFSDYQGRRPQAINPVSPLYHDGFIHVTSGYDDGGALLELAPDGASVKRKWVDKTLDNHHGQVIYLDGYLYGSNWLSNTRGNWVCLDFATGKVMYEKQWINKGSVIYADGMLYCYEEGEGAVGLVKPTPTGFELVSSFKVTQGSAEHWAHPVISDGRLYIRHGSALMAYDIKESTPPSELEGNWIGYQPYGLPGDWLAEISGNSCVFEGPNPDEWYVGKFKLNTTTNPKWVDFTITDCVMIEYIGATVLGIYKKQGNTFTMAANPPGYGSRPTGFYADETTILFEFKKK